MCGSPHHQDIVGHQVANSHVEIALLDAMDTERLTMGPEKSAPYVQVQAAGKGGRTVRAYRFPSEAGEAGEE